MNLNWKILPASLIRIEIFLHIFLKCFGLITVQRVKSWLEWVRTNWLTFLFEKKLSWNGQERADWNEEEQPGWFFFVWKKYLGRGKKELIRMSKNDLNVFLYLFGKKTLEGRTFFSPRSFIVNLLFSSNSFDQTES